MAQSSGSLPLEGWYRAGRYMPVRLDGNGLSGAGVKTIAADGAVPVECEGSGGSEIVPLLIFTSTAGPLRIESSSVADAPPLRALSSHQQLVAVAGTGDRLAEKLFPGESIVTVHVDPLNPLPGPAIAWQTLDALIVDGPWPAGLDLGKVPALLAGGTQIAVQSVNRPQGALPWEAIDGGWVLRPAIAGPMGCDGNDAAYESWGAWHPDLPGKVRGRVVLAGLLFSLIALGCFLLPAKWVTPAIVIAVAGAMICIAWWRSSFPGAFVARGSVIVAGSAIEQEDRWQFVTVPQPATRAMDCGGEMWPVFADASQAGQVGMTLKWEDGAGRFDFALPMNGRLAFMSRTLHSAPTPPATEESAQAQTQTQTPMSAIARDIYQRAHERVTVERAAGWDATADSPEWAGVRITPE
jgi:hypothetical protein